jgi:hypothetical protein
MTDPTLHDVPIDTGVGGYVRWRPRMVRLSVFNDLTRTLTATGWIGNPGLQYPFDVKEFFPEFATYQQDRVHVNTLTIDDGDPQLVEDFEMGLDRTRVYRISMACYAQDNDTGIAVFSDLSDRYEGVTDAPFVSLFDYNQDGPDYPLVTRMEVETFQFSLAPQDAVPYEHHLFFAELVVRDFIDGNRVDMPT